MKYMAIDFGDVRTGVAFSDLSGTLAGHSLTVTAGSRDQLLERLLELYEAEQPDGGVVLGLPRNMDGSEGPRAQKTRAFGQDLARMLGVDIQYWDERGTSVSAGRLLSDAGKKRQKQRSRIDAVAAGIILQGYLDYKRNQAR